MCQIINERLACKYGMAAAIIATQIWDGVTLSESENVQYRNGRFWYRCSYRMFTAYNQFLTKSMVIISVFDGERRFTILTTNANESMQAIHHRMPVLLKQDELRKWLWDYQFALGVLNRIPMQLVRTEENETGQLHF